MKKPTLTILSTFYKLIIWFVIMIATVTLCVFVENGFSLKIDEKSDNLVLYWLIGGFVYPVIRNFKGKSQKSNDASQKIELEKEQQRLNREEKALELKQKQEEQLLAQKNNYALVRDAIKSSKLSHKNFLYETQALVSDLNIVENKFYDLEHSLNEIKQRNEMLLVIMGTDKLITTNRKKLQSLNNALNSTQTLLMKE